MATISAGPRVARRFLGLKLRQFFISTIGDQATVALGTVGCKYAATRPIVNAPSATGAIGSSTTPWDGASATNRRHQPYFATDADAAAGTITYDVTTASGASVLMVWSKN